MQEPYRCCNFGVWNPGTLVRVSNPNSHLVSITRKDYDEVASKLTVTRDIYIADQPYSVTDLTIRRNRHTHTGHGSGRVRLSLVFPDFVLKRFEELGLSLAGYASRHGPESSQDMKVRRGPGGDVSLEFE